MIDRLSHRLLRRHVCDSSERRPLLGEDRLASQLREAEVHDLRLFLRGDNDVGRLDIPVYDISLVRLAEPPSNLHRDIEGGGQFYRPILDH